MCVRPRQSHGSKCDSWRTILVWFAAPKFMGLVILVILGSAGKAIFRLYNQLVPAIVVYRVT